jgi:hypothetical protein
LSVGNVFLGHFGAEKAARFGFPIGPFGHVILYDVDVII